MITRRDASKALATMTVLAGVRGRAAFADAGAAPVVRTTYGEVQGLRQGEVSCFLGIPYGASTAGSNRFMPPLPPPKWNGVRRCVEFGPSCPQVSLGVSPFLRKKPGADATPPAPTETQRQLKTLFTSKEVGEAEDCLVLNVWTPDASSGKRPVMVWLHGGGFAVGSGSAPASDGARLAQRGDVVVVTINHRLNVFGYLFLGESSAGTSGNAGMLDVVAALRWVRANITRFGGDPDNVTLFGESGGAGKVSVVCAMPAAKGLFHKAIMQSGPCLQIQTKERASAITRQLFQDLGLRAGDVAALQKMDAHRLAAAADAAETKVVPRVLGHGPMGLIPLIDAVTLTHHPFDREAAPESAAVPFLVGSTRDEAVLFAGPFPRFGELSRTEVIDLMQPALGAKAAEVFDFYAQQKTSSTPSYILSDIITDYWMRQAAYHVAELKANQGQAPAYVYVLQWRINDVLRSPHGADVALAFNNVASSPALVAAPGAQQVSDQMSDAWVAFARTGNPAGKNAPALRPYTPEHRDVMLLDTQSRVVNDYDRARREFWVRSGLV